MSNLYSEDPDRPATDRTGELTVSDAPPAGLLLAIATGKGGLVGASDVMGMLQIDAEVPNGEGGLEERELVFIFPMQLAGRVAQMLRGAADGLDRL
jgi:hypothetical protein